MTTNHPAEWVLVPREPTEEMLRASPVVGTGIKEDGSWGTNTRPARDVWRAMLSASPVPVGVREKVAILVREALICEARGESPKATEQDTTTRILALILGPEELSARSLPSDRRADALSVGLDAEPSDHGGE